MNSSFKIKEFPSEKMCATCLHKESHHYSSDGGVGEECSACFSEWISLVGEALSDSLFAYECKRFKHIHKADIAIPPRPIIEDHLPGYGDGYRRPADIHLRK